MSTASNPSFMLLLATLIGCYAQPILLREITDDGVDKSIDVMELKAALPLASSTPSQPCNGFTELCGRRYSEVAFAAAHNAGFVGHGIVHNQFQGPEAALAQGIRYFTTQVHLKDGEIRQCHTHCALLDAGPVSEILASLKTWVDRHPRDVVTLLVTKGIADIDVEDFAPVFEETRADQIAFRPEGILGLNDWPTLGEIIESGKRLVVFMDYDADLSKVPYIIPQFDHYVETPFSPAKESFFNCDVDRPNAGGSANNRMIFANHNLNLNIFGLLLPDQGAAANTNSVANIKQQTDLCVSKHGRNPNVVMVSPTL